MNITSLEEVQHLEDIRLETRATEEFKQWAKSLNVSKLYVDPQPLNNASRMNREYNYGRKNKVARLIERIYL